ncbi:MAG: glycosyltransferase, partial [Phycisphaerae bacterium]
MITNGVDLEAIQGVVAADRSEFGGASDQFVILFVGRLTEQKAPLDLLQAFAALPLEQRNQCRLVFAGDGPLREELSTQIERRGLRSLVHVAGRIARVPEWMKASDLLVLPSRWEGLPNVVLEAMAAGLPVIAADVDGVRELVTGPDIGRLYPSGDLQALSSLLSEAFCSRRIVGAYPAPADHRKPYVASAKALTWDRCVDEYD